MEGAECSMERRRRSEVLPLTTMKLGPILKLHIFPTLDGGLGAPNGA